MHRNIFIIIKNKILFIICILVLFFKIKSQEFFDTLSCNYPFSHPMDNGNNLILCSDGIYLYNSNLENQLYFYNTQLSDTTYDEFITISQIQNNGNIIIITKDKFYFLTPEGKVLFYNEITLDNKGNYYTLVA